MSMMLVHITSHFSVFFLIFYFLFFFLPYRYGYYAWRRFQARDDNRIENHIVRAMHPFDNSHRPIYLPTNIPTFVIVVPTTYRPNSPYISFVIYCNEYPYRYTCHVVWVYCMYYEWRKKNENENEN